MSSTRFPNGKIQALTLAPAPRAWFEGAPFRSLHLNESPFPPPPRAVEAMSAAAQRLNRYPDHNGSEFVQLVAEQSGVATDRIVLGAGSSDLLLASAELALEIGDEAIVPSPGFPGHAKSVVVKGGRIIAVANRPDGAVDVTEVLAAVTPRSRLAFITSPHNPTGSLLDAADVTRLAETLPDHVFLHFDEAYHEFGRHAGGPDVAAILESRRRGPWLISRSMSKAYGLAGVRIGYGLASSVAVADAYRKLRATFSINAIALAGAAAALQEHVYVGLLLDHTARERIYLAEHLAKYRFETISSRANFASFVTPVDAGQLAGSLAEQNVLVLPFVMSDGRAAVRISIGTREDSDALLAALGTII